jgi:hypothetical protein
MLFPNLFPNLFPKLFPKLFHSITMPPSTVHVCPVT